MYFNINAGKNVLEPIQLVRIDECGINLEKISADITKCIPFERIEPIPLYADVFESCGFKKETSCWANNSVCIYEWEDEEVDYHTKEDYRDITDERMLNLHQLQYYYTGSTSEKLLPKRPLKWSLYSF